MMVEFTDPWALYAFLLFIPIIILYLLRPKPKDMHIPSLMFIMNMEHRKRFRSFFKRIVRDPLLILQLIAISVIILVMANPFYISEETKRIREDVVVILDVSASMQASGRFASAKQTAQSIVGDLDPDDKVSLVLAGKIPIVILKQGDKARAQSLLDAVKPGATPTSLGGAILLAADLVKDSEVEKRMFVVSDFSHYEGVDPLTAQKQAFAKGIGVEFIRVEGGKENLGIISARGERSAGTCSIEAVVKNYGGVGREVQVDFILDSDKVGSQSKAVGAGASEVFRLSSVCTTSSHKAIASISSVDDLGVDNKAYVLLEEVVEWDVLLIRERDSDEHVRYALESVEGVSVDEAHPPIYPQSYEGYDTIIFQDSDSQNILGGTFAEIRKFLEGGGNLIVMGFEGLSDVPPEYFSDVLPVEPIEVSYSGGNPTPLFEHQILDDVDVDEIRVHKYLYADEKVGSITLARMKDTPLITLWDVGNGDVLYMGISANASWSDFYLKPSFPIFWHDVLQWINRDESAGSILNFKTGEQLPFVSEQVMRVRKPSGETIEGVDILLDETGFYEVEGTGQSVAASLLDEKESDINYYIETVSKEIRNEYVETKVKEEVTNQLFWLLALVALGLVLLEWFYYKGRGSI